MTLGEGSSLEIVIDTAPVMHLVLHVTHTHRKMLSDLACLWEKY